MKSKKWKESVEKPLTQQIKV